MMRSLISLLATTLLTVSCAHKGMAPCSDAGTFVKKVGTTDGTVFGYNTYYLTVQSVSK